MEILMSIAFLAGLIVVCLNIFKKQQDEMLNAIQEIEITSTVNLIRMTLKNPSACLATFEDKKVGSNDIQVVKKIIQYPETDEYEEVDSFPSYQYGKKTFGVHKLKISGFQLTEYEGSSAEESERALKFVVNFDKNIPDYGKKNSTSRVIKVYAQTDNLGRVESCGLGRVVDVGNYFENRGENLKRENGNIGIGTKLTPSRLSIGGGLQFFIGKRNRCRSTDNGLIFMNPKDNGLVICHFEVAIPLTNTLAEGL